MAVRSSSRRDDEDALDPVEAADEGGVDDVDQFTADAIIEGEEPFEEDSDEDVDVVSAEPSPAPDEDDDEPIVVVDDDEEVEGVRDGEFVCRGCYMAKRETQLADTVRLLCRDCV